MDVPRSPLMNVFPGSLPVVDMPEVITIKNTFVDVAIPAVMPNRRCSSVPRSWTPGGFLQKDACGKSAGGEASTTASDISDTEMLTPTSDLDSLAGSDKDFLAGTRTPSDNGEFECLECNTDSAVKWGVNFEGMTNMMPQMPLNLCDFVAKTPENSLAAPPTRTSLKAAARPFASMSLPTFGMQMVLNAAKAALESAPTIGRVEMLEGAIGSTWTLLAHTSAHLPGKNPRYYTAAAKRALLTSAEQTLDTYVLGYEANPFTKLDKFSFSATLATIPDSQQKIACWDSYKNGACPRRLTCRWAHPSETQVINVVVKVQYAEREWRGKPEEE